MRSIVFKHGAVELEDDCITISDSQSSNDSKAKKNVSVSGEYSKIITAHSVRKKEEDAEDDSIILSDDSGVGEQDKEAIPYVFPTLEDKQSDSEQELSSNADDVPTEEPFDIHTKNNSSAVASMTLLYDEMVHKSIAEASRILEDAHSRAQRDYQELMAQGQVRLDEERSNAIKQGISDGSQTQVIAIRNCISKLELAVAAIEGKQEDFFAELERDTKWLSLQIAEKVMSKSLEKNELEIIPLVREAVSKAKNSQWLTLEISDQASELLEELKAQLEKGDTKISVTAVQAQRGTCRIQTPDGFIDASIYRQLDNLRDYFSSITD